MAHLVVLFTMQEILKNLLAAKDSGENIDFAPFYREVPKAEIEEIQSFVARNANFWGTPGDVPDTPFGFNFRNQIFPYSADGKERPDPHHEHPFLDFLKLKLKDAPLFDLGGGRIYHSMLNPARYLGATYINVDLAKNYRDLDPHKAKILTHQADDLFPEAYNTILIEADMLEVVTRLPDNSVNFVINGIDRFVIPHGLYHARLQREVQRATRVGGIAFGYYSDILNGDWSASFDSVDPAELGLEVTEHYFLHEKRRTENKKR